MKNLKPKKIVNRTDITKSGFLNALDGFNELTDAIVVITTNFLERFDPAIYRPRRVDILINLSYMETEDIQNYLLQYYELKTLDRLKELYKSELAPSKIEQICQIYNSVDLTVDELKRAKIMFRNYYIIFR